MTTTTASDKVIVDSSGWLEYFTSGPKADIFAPYLEGTVSVLIPTVVLYEVRKVLLLREGKTKADAFLSEAFKRISAPFDERLAISAAELSLLYKLPRADAIIYATALDVGAQLVTTDSHFANVPGVKVV